MATMSYNKLVAHEVGKAEQADLGGVGEEGDVGDSFLSAGAGCVRG